MRSGLKCSTIISNIVASKSAANTTLTHLTHLLLEDRRCIIDTIPQDNTPRKKCIGPCGQWLPATTQFFHSNGKRLYNGFPSLYGMCKQCRNAEARERYKHPEAKEKKQAYAQDPVRHDSILAKKKQRLQIPEVKARHQITKKKYYDSVSKTPEYRQQRSIYFAKYYQTDQGKNMRQVIFRNHESQRRGSVGKITTQEWKDLKAFYDYRCLCCGKQEPEIRLEIDHVIPVSRGGSNMIDNIQPLCRSCNAKKSNWMIDYRPK